MNTYPLASARALWQSAVGFGSALGFALLLALVGPAAAQDWVPLSDVQASAHTVSPEVRALPEAAGRVSEVLEIPIRHRPSFVPGGGPQAPDPVLQTSPGAAASTAQGVGFDGVPFNGYYPPDANLSVGDTQLVQTTNVQFAVYAKTGTLLKGPVAMNTLFANLGGLCSSTNGGDPIVLWDKIKKRWLISQLAYTSNLRTNYVCVAVSQTADATGAFNLYAFKFSRLPDYPKFGVWSSSDQPGGSDYYLSANLFSTALYFGPVVCAFNGADMQTGAAARFACVQGGTSHFSLLPSDHDGAAPPAVGEPNYFVELGTGISASTGNTLVMFPFMATWSNTGGTLNNPTAVTIPVAQYALACSNGGTCIPQPGTTKQLDSLGDRLMYRLAFRKFATYESLLVNHAVDQGNGVVGIRWYEIQSSGGGTLATTASVHQQGTFTGADGNYRWMGSMAQDNLGNIALGYSVSSTSLYPSIRYAARGAGDPLGTLGGETTLLDGLGAETGASRWGDYTSMSVDPADDCTFWYTNEYLTANASGGIAWNTRIASFRFSTCGGGGTTKTPTSTALASSLNSSTFGASVTFTATVTGGSGTPTGSVTFLDGATTLGATALDGTGKATYTTSSLALGSHTITAAYGGDSAFDGSTSDALTQTVDKAASAMALSSDVNPSVTGQTVTFTATVTPSSPSAATGTVDFADGSTSLGSAPLDVSGQAKLATAALAAGTHSISATYAGDPNFNGATSNVVTQTVNAAPTGTFSLSASPPSVTASQSSTATFTITVTPAGGFTGNVTLSASGAPPQSSASFAPNPVAASSTSTLTITIGRNTPKKDYIVTITGNGGGASATTTVTISVR